MRQYLAVLFMVLFVTPGHILADTAPLKSLQTADEAKAWRAVGRLNIGRTGFCTAALIAPNRVLTAAHCVVDKDSGKMVAPGSLEFLAGWRNGTAAAVRKARRVAVHPDYNPMAKDFMQKVGTDIAVIELDQPIRASSIPPMAWLPYLHSGDRVQVVSYGQGRSEAPSFQEECDVLKTDARVVVLNCSATFGTSGSPVFFVQDGYPKIASVVSAGAHYNKQKVSLGVSLGRPLEKLLQKLASTDAVAKRVNPTMSLAEQLGRSGSGAKVLKARN